MKRKTREEGTRDVYDVINIKQCKSSVLLPGHIKEKTRTVACPSKEIKIIKENPALI